MPEDFLALEAFVRGTAHDAADVRAAAPRDANASERKTQTVTEECPCRDSLAAVRRFHAALADALELALERMMRDLACDVLARELRLAPAEIATIAARALDKAANELPVSVRSHPDETHRLTDLGVPVIADSTLRRGDVVLDVQSGSIDASLGARLACAVEHWRR